MKRKVISILMVVALTATSLAGCGKTEDTSSVTIQRVEAEEEEAESEEEEASPEEEVIEEVVEEPEVEESDLLNINSIIGGNLVPSGDVYVDYSEKTVYSTDESGESYSCSRFTHSNFGDVEYASFSVAMVGFGDTMGSLFGNELESTVELARNKAISSDTFIIRTTYGVELYKLIESMAGDTGTTDSVTSTSSLEDGVWYLADNVVNSDSDDSESAEDLTLEASEIEEDTGILDDSENFTEDIYFDIIGIALGSIEVQSVEQISDTEYSIKVLDTGYDYSSLELDGAVEEIQETQVLDAITDENGNILEIHTVKNLEETQSTKYIDIYYSDAADDYVTDSDFESAVEISSTQAEYLMGAPFLTAFFVALLGAETGAFDMVPETGAEIDSGTDIGTDTAVPEIEETIPDELTPELESE